jgi:3-deoxy-D-manno-octulosonic-acid transferase
MGALYTLSIYIFLMLMSFAAFFNKRARQWVEGRRGWKDDLRKRFPGNENVVWIHCASLGEFEQGRPVIESLKENDPSRKVLVTFFSPSGYGIMKDWKGADHIVYLPGDTPANAAEFLDIVAPSMAIIVKYEFWNNFISETDKRRIPLYLISAIFRADQHFFRWYGGFYLKQLKKFTQIFVQEKGSEEILKKAGITQVTVTGDTRVDRVAQISATAAEIPLIAKFRGDGKLFLAGSSWPGDEAIITAFINSNPGRMKWVFAPHEIAPSNIKRIESLLKVKCARYSAGETALEGASVLIIDNIGMLSAAYRYAYIAAVGGGFGKGIHNILEPACWGIPVLFGPDHRKFREAVELIGTGGAFTFCDSKTFSEQLEKLLGDEEFYRSSADMAKDYILKNRGVTAKIIGVIDNRDINKKGG